MTSKKNIFKWSILYIIFHLVFWPTFETDKGFDEIKKQVGGAMVSVRLTGSYRETGSRILNIVHDENPYFIQIFMEIDGNQYDRAAFERVILLDKKNNAKIVLLEHREPFDNFSRDSGTLPVVGFSSGFNMKTNQGEINLNYNDYIVQIKIIACEKSYCKTLKMEGMLKYRVKRKFYSNTFATMMGI